MNNKKYIVIIILLFIALGLTGAYAVLGPNGYKTTQQSKDFLENVLELQSTLSYYVGNTHSDAFGIFEREDILAGKTSDGEQIKDNKDQLLPALINRENSVEYKNNKKGYELNLDNVNTTLSLSIPKYEGITFYVVDGDIVKIKMSSTPSWWNGNFDVLLLN